MKNICCEIVFLTLLKRSSDEIARFPPGQSRGVGLPPTDMMISLVR